MSNRIYSTRCPGTAASAKKPQSNAGMSSRSSFRKPHDPFLRPSILLSVLMIAAAAALLIPAHFVGPAGPVPVVTATLP